LIKGSKDSDSSHPMKTSAKHFGLAVGP